MSAEAMTERADAGCCLSDLGSVKTPKCIVLYQKGIMTMKGAKIAEMSPPGACAGRSLVEMMEDALDGIVNWLKDTDMETADMGEVENMRGRAQGIAECIAIIQNPYAPNIDSVRADSVRRWEWRQEQAKKPSASWSSAGSRASEVEDLETGE